MEMQRLFFTLPLNRSVVAAEALILFVCVLTFVCEVSNHDHVLLDAFTTGLNQQWGLLSSQCAG